MNKTRKSQKEKYCIISNELILESCRAQKDTEEEIYFPLYFYSRVNSDYWDNYLVDTNISLIQSTITNYGRGFQQTNKIRKALKIFGTPERKYIDYRYKLDNVKNNTRLQFYVIPFSAQCKGGYTTFDYDEYNYIVDSIYFQQISKNDNERAYNTLILMNLYAYFKMRITQYSAMDSKDNPHYMNESQKTIAKYFNRGNKVISEYINRLIEMGMLKKVEEKVQRPRSAFGGKTKTETVVRGYVLSNEWRKTFERKENDEESNKYSIYNAEEE